MKTLLIYASCGFMLSLSAMAGPQWMVPDGVPQPNQWFAWRGTFASSDQAEGAVADLACDSKYWLWVNGELVVREGALKRGPTPTATYMDRVDLSAHVKRGTNTIAILHWFFGKHGYSHNNSGSPGLYFNLSGIKVDWKVKRHPAYGKLGPPKPNHRLAEASVLFDAGKGMAGWSQPGFDDSAWPGPIPAGPPGAAPWGPLELRPVPQWKDWGVHDYVEIDAQKQGDHTLYACKLPYNCQAHAILTVKATAGRLIEFETDARGAGRRTCLRGGYLTRDGLQTYEHLPWISGHRMVYTIPNDVEVVSLTFRETGYDADLIGSWRSDDPVLDELWQRSYRTLYLNMRDSYMDCPDRERAQWWGDVVVQLGQNLYLFDYDNGQALLRKGILELARWQRADGALYSPVPSGVSPAIGWSSDGSVYRELPYQMLASIGRYGFLRYWQYTGDTATMAIAYPHVKKYLSLWGLDDNGLTALRVPEGSLVWVDWGDDKDTPVLASCWHTLALTAAVDMARLTGHEADAAAYETQIESISTHFHEVYWQGNAYRSAQHTGATDDRANAMAVVAGLAPEAVYPELRKVLNEQMQASPYMEKYVLEALFQMGFADDALARMKRRYHVMLEIPITTLREYFHPTTGTDNHAWSGGVLTLMEEYIAGIAPTSPSYDTYRIRPLMGSVKRLDTTVATPRGPLHLALKDEGQRFRLHLHPPRNSVGEIHIPNPNKRPVLDIIVNGKALGKKAPAAPNADLEWIGHRDGYEVLSGVRSAMDLSVRFE